jgi:hypothetical protein
VPIDHASALTFHNDWSIDEHSAARDREIPEGHIFGDRCTRLAHHGIDRAVLEAICLAIPEPWLGRREFSTFERQRHAYAAYLWKRQRALL